MAASHGQVALPQSASSCARQYLTEAEWRNLEAITARIIPTTATAGVREAEVVRFIDRMLASHYAGQPAYRAGLHQLAELSAGRFGCEFSKLEESQQDCLLRLIASGGAPGWNEGAAFFEMVRMHTIEGFLSDPKYGGNRDRVAWLGLL